MAKVLCEVGEPLYGTVVIFGGLVRGFAAIRALLNGDTGMTFMPILLMIAAVIGLPQF